MKKLIFLAFFLLVFSIFISQTKAEIYIDSCTNLDQEGETYILTQDIIDSDYPSCMRITANNIVLDCQNHIIDSRYGYYGIDIRGLNNIIIKNCVLKEWPTGILLLSGFDVSIINTTLENGGNDIYFYALFEYHCNNYFENVTGSGNRPIKYFNYSVNLANEVLSYLILCNADYSNITNVTIDGSPTLYNNGFHVVFTDYSNFDRINSSYNSFGFKLEKSVGNSIINSIFEENGVDLLMWTLSEEHCNNYFENVTGSGNRPIKYFNYSVNLANEVLSQLILCNADYSNITNVTIDDSPTLYNNGFHVAFTDYSNFDRINSSYNLGFWFMIGNTYNTVTNSIFDSSIWFAISTTSYYNTISSNIFHNTKIHAYGGIPNKFYNNLFNNTFVFVGYGFHYFNTTRQPGTRIYSAGAEIGGNYWTNSTGNGYSDTCADEDRDGFCDEPYVIRGNNIDYLPYSNKYGYPLPTVCGNGICETGEDMASCFKDCGGIARKFLLSTTIPILAVIALFSLLSIIYISPQSNPVDEVIKIAIIILIIVIAISFILNL